MRNENIRKIWLIFGSKTHSTSFDGQLDVIVGKEAVGDESQVSGLASWLRRYSSNMIRGREKVL